MFQSIAHRYSRSPAIEPLAKERGEILLTTNNPPHGQINTDGFAYLVSTENENTSTMV